MIDYILKKSRRKTLSISIDDDLNVVVKAPQIMPKIFIDSAVKKNEKWINEHKKIKSDYIISHPEKTQKEIEELRRKAKEYLPQRVEYYSNIMNVTPTGIKITSAKKRFGSCSGKNSICFSLYLMTYPSEAIDYVVVHELSHIKHHNHSKEFYDCIKSVLPDYKEREKLLKK